MATAKMTTGSGGSRSVMVGACGLLFMPASTAANCSRDIVANTSVLYGVALRHACLRSRFGGVCSAMWNSRQARRVSGFVRTAAQRLGTIHVVLSRLSMTAFSRTMITSTTRAMRTGSGGTRRVLVSGGSIRGHAPTSRIVMCVARSSSRTSFTDDGRERVQSSAGRRRFTARILVDGLARTVQGGRAVDGLRRTGTCWFSRLIIRLWQSRSGVMCSSIGSSWNRGLDGLSNLTSKFITRTEFAATTAMRTSSCGLCNNPLALGMTSSSTAQRALVFGTL